jgi:hypothetical protein
MSLLCDIFVASSADASIYHELLISDDGVIAPPRFNVESYNGLTPETFANLAKIIGVVVSNGLTHIAHADDGQWWLEQLEPEFVEALGGMDAPASEKAAIKWFETDQSIWNEESANEILADLKRLALIARSESKGMYLWGSI